MKTITAKTILSAYMQHGWFGVNYNINLYRGCSHGCIYCDSRSECYRIDDFETVAIKENALKILDKELCSKRRAGIVLTGSMSDPYNPMEKDQLATRGALKLFDKHGFGVIIITKSDLVVRDLDILQAIGRHSPAVVHFTVTCADDSMCRLIEPHAPSTSQRLEALSLLAENGISCGVLAMPILPFVNDTEDNVRRLALLAKQSGAKYIYAGGSFAVSCRDRQRAYLYQQLDQHFPDVKEKYIRHFSDSYWCASQNRALNRVFAKACRENGLPYRMEEIEHYIQSLYLFQPVLFS